MSEKERKPQEVQAEAEIRGSRRIDLEAPAEELSAGGEPAHPPPDNIVKKMQSDSGNDGENSDG